MTVPVNTVHAKKLEIDEVFRTFRPGVYRHYKGGLYRALGLVAHHDTREPWVLYVSLTQGSANIRPYQGADGWCDEVEVDAITVGILVQGSENPNVKVPRFELVNESLDGMEDR